jgi:hypothetical protein
VNYKPTSIVSLLFILMFYISNSVAKPSAPVEIQYDQPSQLSSGDTFNVLLKIKAKRPLVRLKISISPYAGLDIIEGNLDTVMEEINRRQVVEIPVTLRLTADDVGYLSVFATTQTRSNTRTKAQLLKFGNHNPINVQRMKSKASKHINGESLILMPGDPR